MTKQITAISLGYSPGNVMSFSMPQGSVILECVWVRDSGLRLHYLEKDMKLPKVTRSFVFYSPWSKTPALENRQRYWHVGTAHQKMEPVINGAYGTLTPVTPDDMTYFVFEVE